MTQPKPSKVNLIVPKGFLKPAEIHPKSLWALESHQMRLKQHFVIYGYWCLDTEGQHVFYSTVIFPSLGGPLQIPTEANKEQFGQGHIRHI